jgi:hypothetical protein
MDNHDDTRSSAPPVSRPLAPVRPLNVNDVDDSLAAAQRSDIAVRANLLPALGITTGHNTRSRSIRPPNLTRPREPTTSPRTITLDGDRPDTLAKPPAKKRRAVKPRPDPTGPPPEPVAGPSAKAAGKRRNPNPPTPPPAKDPSPIQKITSAIKKKIPSIHIRSSNKSPPTAANALPIPQVSTYVTPDTPVLTRPSAYTTPIATPAEEDDTVTLKKSVLRQMLQDAVEEFATRGRRNTALQPAVPHGDAQGWSDGEDDDKGPHADGVQFAESLQTTPGKYCDLHSFVLASLAPSLAYSYFLISRT